MKAHRLLWVALAAVFITVVVGVQAQVPQVINYQGQLTDGSGNPANGTFTMVFKIFNVSTGGSAMYTETQSVNVSNGVFNVLLGSVTPIPLDLFDSGTERFLEITVGGTVLTPRRRFGSVPYAFTSRGGSGDITAVQSGTGLSGGGTSGDVTLRLDTGFADDRYVNEGQADAITSRMIQDGAIVNADVSSNAAIAGLKINPNFGSQNIFTSGRVGIGATNPARMLQVHDEIHSSGSSAAYSFGNRQTSSFVEDPTAGERWAWYSSNGTARLWSGSDKLSVSPSGNLGIGTTSPMAKLHIAGKAGVDGIRFPDGTLQTTAAIGGGGGDITAVRDGAGLTGGGESGDITLAVANNGITSDMIRDNTIKDVDVRSDAAIAGTKIDPNFGSQNVVTSGKVGIGTASPTAKLHIAGTPGTDGIRFPDGTLQTTAATGGGGGGDITAVRDGAGLSGGGESGDVTLAVATNGITSDMLRDNTIKDEDVRSDAAIAGTKIDPTFGSQNVVTNGKVGIGTASPTAKLHIAGTPGTDGIRFPDGTLQTTAATGGGGGGIQRITEGDAIEVDDPTGPTTKISVKRNGITSDMIRDNTIKDEDVRSDAAIAGLKINPNFGLQNVITSGKVGIGVSTPTNILTIQQNSTTDPIADAWTTYSSRRWKTNIRPIAGALDKVQRLRGVYYDWKADGKHDLGLIAEEVGEVIPEVVTYEANGKDASSVDYARLVALLIEAVKEQQKEIAELKSTIKSLVAARKMGNNSVGE